MPITTNYTAHRMSGGMPNDASTRVNDILLESQKMIYAPPSREKSKQTVRSPLIDKGKSTNIGNQIVPLDEYSQQLPGAIYQQPVGGQKKKQQGTTIPNMNAGQGKFQPEY